MLRLSKSIEGRLRNQALKTEAPISISNKKYTLLTSQILWLLKA